MLSLFRKNTDEIKDLMIDHARNHPNEVIYCHEYMVVYIEAQDRVIFIPVTYRGLDDQGIRTVITRRLKNPN